MTKLENLIQERNRTAGLERQKCFAKKSYLKMSEAAMTDMLLERIGEFLEEQSSVRLAALKQAAVICRRQRGRL